MVSFDVIGFGDVGVIAQPVVHLRAVGLWVNRLQADVFDVGLFLRTFGFWLDVQAAFAAPYARHRREGAEVGEGVKINRARFGVDVLCHIFPLYFFNLNSALRACAVKPSPCASVEAMRPKLCAPCSLT